MKKIIAVAGASGNLGKRICRELIARNAEVRAIVRTSTDDKKIRELEGLGVKVIVVDLTNVDEIAKALAGTACLVSVLAGLREVIVDLQQTILDGAILAGVPRFIPSDFCTDYNELETGDNRNFDLRKEFESYLDSKPIKASSVFNGAFSDILQYNTPVLNLKNKSIAYWGDRADWKLDFTTMDNTAAFTAEVALDDNAPRDLDIASFQISPNMIREAVKKITGEEFSIQQFSGLEEFREAIKKQRAENPAGENELYARWQQAQYMYCMFSTRHKNLANDRYNGITWTSGEEFLKTMLS